MTREESEKGTQRATRGSAGNLANVKSLWNDAAPVAPSVNVSPSAGMWFTHSAAQQTPRSRASYPDGGAGAAITSSPAHPVYNNVDEYQQYYEQPLPGGAQRLQTYYPL